MQLTKNYCQMKGLNLTIRILIPIALLLFVIVGVLNYADSLSGHHMTAYDPLLYMCLMAIVQVFFSAANVVKEENKELTKIFGISYKLRHALRWTGWFFIAVVVFGVNNHSEILWGVEVYHLHLFFTAMAIITGYTIVLFYPEEKKDRNFSYAQTAFGAIGFALGFWLGLYSTTWAEFLAALPITYTVYKIIRK